MKHKSVRHAGLVVAASAAAVVAVASVEVAAVTAVDMAATVAGILVNRDGVN